MLYREDMGDWGCEPPKTIKNAFELTVDKSLIRERRIQSLVLEKMLKHTYEQQEHEALRLFLIEELKYNEELYKELQELKEEKDV